MRRLLPAHGEHMLFGLFRRGNVQNSLPPRLGISTQVAAYRRHACLPKKLGPESETDRCCWRACVGLPQRTDRKDGGVRPSVRYFLPARHFLLPDRVFGRYELRFQLQPICLECAGSGIRSSQLSARTPAGSISRFLLLPGGYADAHLRHLPSHSLRGPLTRRPPHESKIEPVTGTDRAS